MSQTIQTHDQSLLSSLEDKGSVNRPVAKWGGVGVLMINLGTPDAPTYGAVRRYLAEFLSDPRVIEVPKPIWLPILYGPILTFRPAKSARAYAKIWDYERGESPLRTIARDQAEGMAKRLDGDVTVAWAMRYGNPTIESGLQKLKDAGCDRILIASMYPHYSASTTATAHDKVFACLKTMRWQPSIRTMEPYFDRADYIGALATSIESELGTLDWQPETLLASYHSIPQAYWDKGDPYPCHCLKTTRLFKETLETRMGDTMPEVKTSYQSRVGPTKWVGPYTDKTVEQMAKDGVKKLAVVAPAFSADCLETLEEINMELRETFLENGGTHFHYIPCLNASDVGMTMLESVVRANLVGWITPDPA